MTPTPHPNPLPRGARGPEAPRLGVPGSAFDIRYSLFVIAVIATIAIVASAQPAAPERAAPAEAYIDLDLRMGELSVERDAGGAYRISVDGGPQGLTPDEFAEVIHREKRWQEEAGLAFVIFNITSWSGLLWVSVGLLGQLLFTFRMVLQWLASEKQHKSVVPVGFWWGSLIGGLMLLTYFVWRKDAIGILGQSTGAFIYARNLWLIYAGQKQTHTAGATSSTNAEPEAAAVPSAPPVHADTGNANG